VDIVVGTGLLIVAGPVLLGAALAVLLASGRPVFFGHWRLGRGGRAFRCWKLRTMVVGAEGELEQTPDLRDRHRRNGFKLPDHKDPRVTRVGRWLRRTYLDELPQLVNVVGGDMSLVGPRPIVPEELDQFEPWGRELLSVRPGLFGAWTSLGRRRPPYPERARVELEYVRRHTVASELIILLRSVKAVIEGQWGR
jgi:lipopolysaccharide/colanic/teichoic acid biosynthesis glycosyltransferase